MLCNASQGWCWNNNPRPPPPTTVKYSIKLICLCLLISHYTVSSYTYPSGWNSFEFVSGQLGGVAKHFACMESVAPPLLQHHPGFTPVYNTFWRSTVAYYDSLEDNLQFLQPYHMLLQWVTLHWNVYLYTFWIWKLAAVYTHTLLGTYCISCACSLGQLQGDMSHISLP